MEEARLKELLVAVRAGTTEPSAALEVLRNLPYEYLEFARVDHHRMLRQGIPEVVLAEGKTVDETVEIAAALFRHGGRVLATRCSAEQATAIMENLGAGFCSHHRTARCVTAARRTRRRTQGSVLILTGGTSDLPVAEEARITLEFLGSKAELVSDVGVAGIHRLSGVSERFREARVIVVVAGMEGALPSVVGGLTDRPIVAVPTSTGYGTAFGGLTALFAMLNSCVPGIGVVNVDNGFGAACLAHRINLRK